MICKATVKRYCKSFEQIENYKNAITDDAQMWECHHKLEAFFTMDELKKIGRYFNVKPRELIFLKRNKGNEIDSHSFWPHKGTFNASIKKTGVKRGHRSQETKDKISMANKGKTRTTEQRKEMSERMQLKWQESDYRKNTIRNRALAQKGLKRSEETKRKISESGIGKHNHSEEFRNKQRMRFLGKHWKNIDGKRVWF